jgi:hypothetical protein
MGPAGWTGNAIDVDRAGVSKLGFSTSNFPSGTVGTAQAIKKQLGGVVKLAGGTKGDGKGGKGGLSGSATAGPAIVVENARKMWDKLLDLGGEDVTGGKIARLLERIQIAEDLADKDGFLTPEELHRQIDLHEKLLKDYRKADRMARRGIDFTQHSMRKVKGDKRSRKQLRALGRKFKGVRTITSGLTGKGGLLLSEKLRLAELRGSSTTSDNEALVSDLQSLLLAANRRFAVSQAQYNIFAGAPIMGAMAKGGVAMRSGNYLVGERGPEVVSLSGGNRVHPNAEGSVQVIVHGDIVSDKRDPVEVVIGDRRFKAAVKNVNRTQARAGGRVLPGRAGS